MDRRLLDEVAAAATAAPVEAHLNGWWCKAAPDLPFRRCNVVLPPPDAGGDRASFGEGLAAVRAWYAALDQRLIVQVSSADPHVDQLDRWLADEGLEVEAPVDVLVLDALGPTAAVPSIVGAGADPVTVQAGVDEPWAAAHGVVVGGDAVQRLRAASYGRMLAAVGERALGASMRRGGEVAGLGFAVVDRGWVGIFGMATAPAHRRCGVATRLVEALVAAAIEQGAERAYLQVELGNAGAVALYEGLGFARSHAYHYRSEGVDPDQGC